MIRYYNVRGQGEFEDFSELTPEEAVQASNESGFKELYFGDQGDGTPWTGLLFVDGVYYKYGLNQPILRPGNLDQNRLEYFKKLNAAYRNYKGPKTSIWYKIKRLLRGRK